MNYKPSSDRYNKMPYEYSGKSGLKLPLISLGLWHNFGHVDTYENAKRMIFKAFDLGITHFDLANNYGPPVGSAEETFGKILQTEMARYRDEMVISSKAGYYMWQGPYGDWGSKKYLFASLHQSLKRMNLEYVDIFYHHRPDPNTPLEETMGALDLMVKQGKALYIGISNYPAEKTREAADILNALGTPCIIHQAKYSMFNRWIEEDLTNVLTEKGIGCIVFSPLAQGMLTDKYLKGIPDDSRAAKSYGFLQKEQITPEVLKAVEKLSELAKTRKQSLAQMALAWVLNNPAVTSALIGASSVNQIEENVKSIGNLNFSSDELFEINEIIKLLDKIH